MILYNTQQPLGETISFSAKAVRGTEFGSNEYCYLLGQTIPFHKTESSTSFPVSELAYIINENGKPEFWTRDTKVLMQFVMVGSKLGYVPLEKQNNGLFFKRFPGIPAVTYSDKERTHTDD